MSVFELHDTIQRQMVCGGTGVVSGSSSPLPGKWETPHLFTLPETSGRCRDDHAVCVWILVYKKPLYLGAYVTHGEHKPGYVCPVWEVSTDPTTMVWATRKMHEEKQHGRSVVFTVVLFNEHTGSWVNVGCVDSKSMTIATRTGIVQIPVPTIQPPSLDVVAPLSTGGGDCELPCVEDTRHDGLVSGDGVGGDGMKQREVGMEDENIGEWNHGPQPVLKRKAPDQDILSPPSIRDPFTLYRASPTAVLPCSPRELWSVVWTRLLLYQMWWTHGYAPWTEMKTMATTQTSSPTLSDCVGWKIPYPSPVNSLHSFLMLVDDQAVYWDRVSFHVIRSCMARPAHPWSAPTNTERSRWEQAEWALLMWRIEHCPRVSEDLQREWKASRMLASKVYSFSVRDIFAVGRANHNLYRSIRRDWIGEASENTFTQIRVRDGCWEIPHPRGQEVALCVWSLRAFKMGIWETSSHDDIRGIWLDWFIDQSRGVWEQRHAPSTKPLHLVCSFPSVALATPIVHNPLSTVSLGVGVSTNNGTERSLLSTILSKSNPAEDGVLKKNTTNGEVKIWTKRPPAGSDEFKHIIPPCMRAITETYKNNAGHLKAGARFRFLQQWRKMGYTWNEVRKSMSPSTHMTEKHASECKQTFDQPTLYFSSCKSMFGTKMGSDEETRNWCPFTKKNNASSSSSSSSSTSSEDMEDMGESQATIKRCRNGRYAITQYAVYFNRTKLGRSQFM
ncbi:unnamed protein product [Sphagnum jensenii]|uniref:Uncharacterized protein n=1 Tax=Sphagnum jensenii TaxID=128206 RepID=A0ABP0VF22_9BRYO